MQWPGAAQSDQGEAAGIVTPAHGDGANALGHLAVQNPVDAQGCPGLGQAQWLGYTVGDGCVGEIF